MKPKIYILVPIISIAIAAIVLHWLGYGVTYQVSASMPKGFYLVRPVSRLYRGEVVLFKPPVAIQRFLIRHHWLPDSGVMMKHIAAMPGDFVCYHHARLITNHQTVLPIMQFYAPSKRLPHYHFCGRLGANQYLLISRRVARSFDGRYFGPTYRDQILSTATLL